MAGFGTWARRLANGAQALEAGRLSLEGHRAFDEYRRTGQPDLLDKAVVAFQAAIAASPPGAPERVVRLANYAACLEARYSDGAGGPLDLDTAIRTFQEALEAIGPGDPDRAGMRSNLGSSLLKRFERDGNPEDLDAAITQQRKAVDSTPADHAKRVMRLSNFGASLRTRFDRDRDPGDLDAAIEAGQAAADLVQPDDADRASALTNLGNSLLVKFNETEDPDVLVRAVQAQQAAVDATERGQPGWARRQSNLGNTLEKRYWADGNPADLDAAITAGRLAVDAPPAVHPDRAGYLSNLSGSLHARFARDQNDADLAAAITYGQLALDLTPHGHPDRALYLENLGRFRHTRFAQTRDPADLDAAIGYWRDASQEPTSPAATRLGAAQRWGEAAAGACRWPEAAAGYMTAVGLLPTVAWTGLDRKSRAGQLARWTGLAADAAACAIRDGRAGLAVELLEQGRSVLWSQALNLRTDLTELTRAAPVLAGRLNGVRGELDRPLPVDPAQPESRARTGDGDAEGRRRSRDLQAAIDRRRSLAREWTKAVAEVRTLHGFGHFLAATPYLELAAAADTGPVIVVNASQYGCDALIIRTGQDRPQVVELPDADLQTIVDRANAILGAVRTAGDPGRPFPQRERDRHAVLGVLDWLWEAIAAPVLARLPGAVRPPGEPGHAALPRVWWCPTGPLTVLPLHAAGHHPRLSTSPACPDSVLDRVVSSYTPTLAALLRAREERPPQTARQLAVGVPETPGLPRLPAVHDELRVLARHFPPGELHRQLVGPAATGSGVLATIGVHTWLHLACHAGQREGDADRSGFALWDGPLTLAALAEQPTRGRDLAFLSACQTAAGSVGNLDEAIHLAAAMQFLGYRGVVATMWTIADSPAPAVAETFYSTLAGHPEAAADALHCAANGLRRDDPTNPLLWAPYLHLGA